MNRMDSAWGDQAPSLEVEKWFNTKENLTLESLRGSVVVIEAFQMLCPGCVSTGLPQAKRVELMFKSPDVQVIGLHSVFEHHEAQTPTSLEAFLYEYRIRFPVAVDQQGKKGRLPKTMTAYELQGTPSLILIDRQGRRRFQHFGQVEDLQLGAQIMALASEEALPGSKSVAATASKSESCDEDGCPI
ncbi:MAG: redoxin domain-containing protein [Pseudomonadota bacterium]